MECIILAFGLGIVFMSGCELYCACKYGSPSLSILIAKCKNSKNFTWLAHNIWGDDDWYYNGVISKMERKQNKSDLVDGGVTPLVELLDGHQVRLRDIRAIRVHEREALSGGLEIPAKTVIAMEGNIGDIRITFPSNLEAREYAQGLAGIINTAAG